MRDNEIFCFTIKTVSLFGRMYTKTLSFVKEYKSGHMEFVICLYMYVTFDDNVTKFLFGTTTKFIAFSDESIQRMVKVES